MADQFKETVKTGWGTRIGNSIKGIFVGILLFLASFAVLYWNEGRVDMSDVAQNAVEISADEVSADADGKFVYLTGNVVTEETLGDGLYLIPGDYLALERRVEMYSWVEETETESDTNMGGSEETTTTYNYVKKWVSEPTETSKFKYPEGHNNPTKLLEDYSSTVSAAKVGVYDLTMDKIDLPSLEKLTLNEVTVDDLMLDSFTRIEGEYIFSGFGSMGNPEVGDLRISYFVLENNVEGTVFGKVEANKIVTYVDQDTETSLYRLFDGTRDEAMATMHGEYKMMLWVFRLVGFLMMWIGLSMLFSPLSVFLDVVPAFGSLSRGVVGALTFAVSLVLSLVTIIISMILHNIVALVVSIVLVVILIVFLMKRKSNKPNLVKA
jgi:hypothetical protein